jgi:tripeptide aminopeptidase
MGLLVHMDTSPEAPGENVKPRVWNDYKGGDLEIGNGVVIPKKDLERCIGHNLVTASGDTLLGGDDKAGISIGMTALKHLQTTDFPRGRVHFLATSDEETGNGTKEFDPKLFPVSCAYTIDGTGGTMLENETFNGAKVTVTFKGKVIHPGEKGYHTLINSITLAAQYQMSLPNVAAPETTTLRDGFIYPVHLEATADRAKAAFIVRDFEDKGLYRLVETMQAAAGLMNTYYGSGTVTVAPEMQYKNMITGFEGREWVVQNAMNAMRAAGVEPKLHYIRGGTDGGRLTTDFGIPTPNLFAGYENPHSLTEFASLNWMESSLLTVINLVREHGKYHMGLRGETPVDRGC